MGSHQAALVCKAAVAAHKRIACNALLENLHAQNISYQLLRFLDGHQQLTTGWAPGKIWGSTMTHPGECFSAFLYNVCAALVLTICFDSSQRKVMLALSISG